MNTQSKKAKGRNFQKSIVEKIKNQFRTSIKRYDPKTNKPYDDVQSLFKDDDVQWRSMGSQGEDVILSPHAREYFPFSIEAKKQERFNIWQAIDQCLENCKKFTPLVIFSKNRRETWVALPLDRFLEIYNDSITRFDDDGDPYYITPNWWYDEQMLDKKEDVSVDYLNNFEEENG